MRDARSRTRWRRRTDWRALRGIEDDTKRAFCWAASGFWLIALMSALSV
jgi:hypothetical protein